MLPNAMLATKISFMNEIANRCERLGADVENVRRGIGSDPRIGFSFIFLGVVMAAPVSPKDVKKTIIGMAKDVGFSPALMQAGVERSETRCKNIDWSRRIIESYGDDLTGLVFGMWGLAFKPGTDDVREASSMVVIRELVGRGGVIKAFDPVAINAIMHEVDSDWIGTRLSYVTISMPRQRCRRTYFGYRVEPL